MEDKDGYLYVKLKHNGKVKHGRINRLVATAFIPNPKNLEQVHHIDFDKKNNQSNNLEWCSVKDNIYKSHKAGNYKKINSKKVIQLMGNYIINEFDSLSEASQFTGIQIANISSCCNGKRKSAGGYQWRKRT